MSTWHHVSHREPCRVCAKPDWCATTTDGAWTVCRRVDNGTGIHKIDKSGADYWLYSLDGSLLCQQPSPGVPSQPHVERADPVTLDRVYRALLAALPLSSMHRQAMRYRGLSDVEILRRGYRTLPREGRAALARGSVDRFGADTCARIPGLYVDAQGTRQWWTLAGAIGLLIPVRDLDGRIMALKMRADTLQEGAKYRYVSSSKHGGPGPGAPVHIPLHDGPQSAILRVTEGELKADIATALSNILTIAIPGVAMWRQAVPVIRGLQARCVLIAFDSDWRTNAHVAQALGHAAFALLKAGYQVEVEDWNPALGKGIDDLVAAGHTPTRHSATLAFGAALRGQARVWTGSLPTIAAEEVPSWRSNR